VAAKRYEHRQGDIDDFLSDRLYGLDANGMVVSGPVAMTHDRFNGKLVRDHSGTLYQLNLELGLVRLTDGQPVVAPGSVSVEHEPRYNLPASISIGFQDAGGAVWGRPLLDAAFDAQGCVYVVPVVVAPPVGVPYMAAAKLRLDGGSQDPGYSIEQIFDDPPAPNDNHAPTQVREVEVDPAGNVYVLNCHYLNSSDLLWVYGCDGLPTARRELQEIGISAPVGLCVSSRDPSKLHIASSQNPPDGNSVKLYVLSTGDLSLIRTIQVHNMGHITDIAETPVTGTICVVGFIMPTIPTQSQIQDAGILSREPFYQPRLAMIPFGEDGPVEAMCPTDAPITNDMALPLSVIHME